MEHYMLGNLRKKVVFSLLIITSLSCNYNIHDLPGPQISSEIKFSKKNKVFICEYKAKNNKILDKEVLSIFAEKQYTLNRKLFSQYDLNCCKSQLIIELKYLKDAIITLNGAPQNWEIIGFKPYHSLLIVTTFEGINFPDHLKIYVRKNIENSSIIDTVVLSRK